MNSYLCNNPNTVQITNNNNYNIFFDTKANIVFIRGSHNGQHYKQIKLGSESINSCSNYNNDNFCVVDNVLKFIGHFDNYHKLIEYTKHCQLSNISFALVNDDQNRQIVLYIYEKNNWKNLGKIIDLSNNICNSVISAYSSTNTSIPSTNLSNPSTNLSNPSTNLSNSSCKQSCNNIICENISINEIESSCSYSSSEVYNRQINYIMLNPEFIDQNKLKPLYLQQLNEKLDGNKFFIKFNEIKSISSVNKFIDTGKYITNYNISFFYENKTKQNNTLTDINTGTQSITNIKYDTITKEICVDHNSLIDSNENNENIYNSGTLVMMCKISKDKIEIISSSIRNISETKSDCPMVINHSFICDYSYGNNIIIVIYPLYKASENVKINILQNSTFIKLDKIE
jgi:hypothetical protein